MDFFVKQPCRFLAVKLEDSLNPRRARFHIFNQIAILFNSIFIAVQRTERCRTFFPQDNSRIQVKRTLFQTSISRVIEHHNRSGILLGLLGIHNLDGIKQIKAALHLVLRASHLRIGDFFGKRFRSAKDFPQAAYRSISRILVRCTARQKLHVHALSLPELVRIFQIAGIAVLQRVHIIAVRVTIQIDHQRIRTSNIVQRIIRHRSLDSQAVSRIAPGPVIFQALFQAKRLAHLRKLFLLKIRLCHAKDYRSLQFRFTLAQGIVSGIGAIPLATVIVIGGASKITMVLRTEISFIVFFARAARITASWNWSGAIISCSANGDLYVEYTEPST